MLTLGDHSPKLALNHQFSLVTQTLCISQHLAGNRSCPSKLVGNNFNEGALYSGVSRVMGINKGTPSAKETGRRGSPVNREGAASY